MSKKVLILRSNSINPDPRVEKLATFLKQNGFHVRIQGWERNALKQNKDSLSTHEIEIFKGIRARGKWAHRLNYLLFQFKIFLKVCFGNYDIVHACDFDTYFSSLIASKISGKPIVYDIFDYYADIILGLPLTVRKVTAKIDNYLMRFANLVIIADHSRIKQVDADNIKRLFIFYNTPLDYLEQFKNIESSEPDSMKEKKFKVIYLGLVDARKRNLKFVIDAIAKRSDCELVIYGTGRDWLKTKKYVHDYKNIEIFDKVSFKDALYKEYLSDAILAIYDPSVGNNKVASPNKLFEAMMLGKPVLMNKEIESAKLVEKYNCGVVFSFNDEDDFSKSLDLLINRENLYSKLASNSRNAYEKDFSYTNFGNKLKEYYHEILS